MFLRSLTLRGFKSFADKTVLEFAPGTSVIVGPNGSGKSNLVDAISWVLGEQGPRALRGGHMADVIFAGSPARPALGMAEVKLVIDNSAGKIPVPMSEIEISRTIFRSGESEYRIGGRACRLLDIQELLAESGIGRALHTVVGQGQLEDVLTARPEDRRRYIEEAAGIAKHRRRKDRAHRKLQSIEQDLLRLQDVLAELRRQLKPLKQQAEVAKRHEQLSAEAEILAGKLAAARLRALLATRESRRATWEEGEALRSRARERLDGLDVEVDEATEARERASADLREREADFRAAQAEKSEAELALREAVEREAGARGELASQAQRTARIAAVEEELARVETGLAETAAALEARERELEAAERGFHAAQEERRAAEEERRRVSEELAVRRAEMETLQRSLTSSDRDRGRLAEALDGVRTRAEEAAGEREALEAEIERLDAEATPVGERKATLERERGGLADEVAELEEALRRHEVRRDLLSARLEDLEETPGSRFVRDRPGRSLGLLHELLRVEPGLERALAAALGPMADAVVYEDVARAVEDAPTGDGATLAVAGGSSPSFALEGERGLLSTVTPDPRVRGLVCTVLRDVYLAESIAEASAKQRKHPKASFVTRDGVLVGPAVIRTTPERDAKAEEIRRELRVVEHDFAAASSKVRPKLERLASLEAELGELTERLETCDAAITGAAERLAATRGDLAAIAKEEDFLGNRLAGLDDSAAAWREALATAEPLDRDLPELPAIPEPPIAARVEVETLRREVEARRARLDRLNAEHRELSGHDPQALRAALEGAAADREGAAGRLRAAEDAMRSASEQRELAVAEERAATEKETEVNRAWREAAAELERLRQTYEDEDRIRGDLERRIRDAERLLREGHGLEPEEVLGTLQEDDTVEGLERRAEVVARRLGLLGKVNLLATGEFEALQERHDFLHRELDDVRKARRDLLELIHRIDEEITAAFDAAYRDVAAEFEALFKELFPGGEGRVVLTDPTDLLATGIEIEARPGRKRVKRISLLSGGERALTALSFLFAIFRARPSPFYLMDEVEPALDDVNLHRFIQLVRGFAAESQVLIVTHQKRTMEAAEMMYGVSMRKDGTSKVLCQRLDGPAEPSAEAGRAAPHAADGDGHDLRVEAERIVVPESDPVG